MINGTNDAAAGNIQSNNQLGPGSLRSSGIRNPDYCETFAFDNDFPALKPASSDLNGNSLQSLSSSAKDSGKSTQKSATVIAVDNQVQTLQTQTNDDSNDNNNNNTTTTKSTSEFDFFQVQPATGKCRVMCYHPNSEVSMSMMSSEQIETVIRHWICEFNALKHEHVHVQIFENK